MIGKYVQCFLLCFCSIKPNCFKSDDNEGGSLIECKSTASRFDAALFLAVYFRFILRGSILQAASMFVTRDGEFDEGIVDAW